MSYREHAMEIISIAQQANPNVIGHRDDLLLQFIAALTDVRKMLASFGPELR